MNLSVTILIVNLSKYRLLAAGILAVSPVTAPAAEIISVNFWRSGGGAHDWQSFLTLDPDETAGFGDWNTAGWQNYQLPWAPQSAQNAVTLTGNEGSSATFVLNDTRNGGPYVWATPRSTLLDDGNGTMMDGHANSTDDPGDGSNIFEFVLTDIPFDAIDVIFYLGANQGQFFDGTGKMTINGGSEIDFTLPSGAFDGTFTEITDADTPGNYIVFTGLSGDSLTARVWGNGFNHIGPFGMQITASATVREPLEITTIAHDENSDEVTLTWKSNPGEVYGIYSSTDQVAFEPNISAAVTADSNANRTSFGPFANPSPGAERVFFRIGVPDLIDPTLDRIWGTNSTISLDFSETMRSSTGTDPANFTVVSDGGVNVPVSVIDIGANPDNLILSTSAPLDADTVYTVTTSNLTDQAGRSLAGSNSASFKTWDNNPDGIKVFILAGQSNMQGHGRNESGFGEVDGAIGSLRYEVDNDPGKYGQLVDAQGDWIARDDVKVWYRTSDLNSGSTVRKGDLLPDFGVDTARFGPEYGFGWELGEYYDEPVLIIKTCWGGKSLYADFRPPSAVAARGGELGSYYVGMFDYVHDVLDDFDTEFPEWAGNGYEIVGFGWHQGWNDGGSDFTASQYEDNMVDLINDIRNEFGKPNLPVSIANTGIGGASVSGNRLTMLEGQLAVGNPALHPEFDGNVFTADTRDFWRESSVSPRDQGFHWNQNGETYYLIGEAIGQGMIDLLNAAGE